MSTTQQMPRWTSGIFVSKLAYHTKLCLWSRLKVIILNCAERVKLLVYVEKGRMYDYLKYSGFGSWEALCSDLGVCRRTADRYIDFSIRLFVPTQDYSYVASE
jgi:hypothetical protein